MPKYLDYHAVAPKFPPEVVKEVAKAIKAGAVDKLGVKDLNVFVTDRGEAYCLTEAPNADAVCESHALIGIKLAKGDIREVSTFV